MELPFHLKTIEPLPGALDIIRYFGSIDSDTADVEEICDMLELSDRRFHKAIRRLVTKGYVMMDGDMIYRLTEQGLRAWDELSAYDDATGGGLVLPDFEIVGGEEEELTLEPAPDFLSDLVPPEISTPEIAPDFLSDLVPPESSIPEPAPAPALPQTVSRRMIVALPQTLVANQPADVVIGFHQAAQPSAPTNVVVRLSVVNGHPATPEDIIFSLGDDQSHQTIQIIPGMYDQVRVKSQVMQMEDDFGAVNDAGGMYVDVPVSIDMAAGQLVAYGTDINLTV
jgi:hypothetical protein